MRNVKGIEVIIEHGGLPGTIYESQATTVFEYLFEAKLSGLKTHTQLPSSSFVPLMNGQATINKTKTLLCRDEV
jgi:hypothetical protein